MGNMKKTVVELHENGRKGQFSWPFNVDYDVHMAFLKFRKQYPNENLVECAKRYLDHLETKGE